MVKHDTHGIHNNGAAEDDERWCVSAGATSDLPLVRAPPSAVPGLGGDALLSQPSTPVFASADFEIGFGNQREIAVRESCRPEFRFHAGDKCVQSPGVVR